jgi:PAS domain-containing protein
MGVPRGHPIVRSFLGAPVLDRYGQVRGGLLLGHGKPDQFTHEDEVLLVGLAAQAAVALENARLYRAAQMRAQELHAIFETIADGVTLVDHEGNLLRENGAARRLRERLKSTHEGEQVIEALLHAPARRALDGEAVEGITVSVTDGSNERREYLVTASPLRLDTRLSSPLLQQQERMSSVRNGVSGVVVVWQDVTERLLRESERQARSQAKQLEAIFEAMTDGVCVYDSNGNIAQMNTTARTLFALDSEPEYASRPLEERLARLVVHDTQGQLFPREFFPQVRLLKGEVLGGVNAVDVLVQALDGREFQASIGGAPLSDQEGRIIGAVMTVRDMSERRRLEQIERQMRAETEARLALLQLILDELTSSVYLVRGHDARLVLANRTAATVWGAAWPVGQPLSAFFKENGIRIFGIDGHLLAFEQLATLRAVQHVEKVGQQQEIIRHPDGTTLPTLVSTVALDGHQLGVPPWDGTFHFTDRPEPAALVVHQDVTALKEAEYLKDEFISIAAHELRTPIAVLKGFAQTLLLQTRRGKGAALADWQLEALGTRIQQEAFYSLSHYEPIVGCIHIGPQHGKDWRPGSELAIFCRLPIAYIEGAS